MLARGEMLTQPHLESLSELELLQSHSAVIEELRRRGVVRTNNNPIGDYTEWLVCGRLGLTAEGNSRAAYDAEDAEGIRYQIKGRRTGLNSVQFSPIRNLEQRGFDFAIAVAFADDFAIRFAVQIPYAVVPLLATYRAHVNGHVLILTDSVVEHSEVEDITSRLA